MDELVKTLKHFIYRDLLYVIGGGAVIVSFLYLFGQLDLQKIPTAVYLLGAGIAYVIGYAIQDGLSLTPVITTVPVSKPGRIVKRLYKCFLGREWQELDSFDLDAESIRINEDANERSRTQLERIISLKHIGTTMGSCGLVSALPLAFKAVETKGGFDFTLVGLVSLASIVLLALSWVKAAQEAEYIARLRSRRLEKKHD